VWSRRTVVISAIVALAIIAGGTTAVVAATNSGSTTNSNRGGGFGGPNGGGPGGGFGAGGGPASFGAGGLGNALHGDFVVAGDNGGYTTERLQTGTVTAVSANSISVKSADGYTQTFAVGGSTSIDRSQNTIDQVVNGNTVTVIGTLSGDTATAITVEDRSLAGNGQQRGMAPPGI
jgi:hypothetical protein